MYDRMRKTVSVTAELQYHSSSFSADGVTFKESGVRLVAGFVIFFRRSPHPQFLRLGVGLHFSWFTPSGGVRLSGLDPPLLC
jgi:hypothetical protein